MKSLSDISNNIDGQPMFKLLDKVNKLERSGVEILHFELGDPDFDTPANISEALCDAVKSGMTHYTSSKGLFEFREAARVATGHSRGFLPDLDQVIVTPGANSIIYLALRCLVNPGEEVIVPDPGFPTYYSSIKVCGAKAVRVPIKEENGFRIDPDDIAAAITDKTRLIILNSPSNPTGAVLTEEETIRIAELVKEKDVYLISDEVYSRMIYQEGASFLSPSYLDKCKERTIILNGFSKAFAMTGWRLGVAIGPAEVMEKMSLLVETIVSCVPPFIQKAGIEAIEGDQTAITHMCSEYRKRRDLLVDGLNKLPGVSCVKPGGAMYVFPNIKQTGMTSQEFADFSLEKAGVALLPGNNFGGFGEGYVRMCYASSLDDIVSALEKLENSLRSR